MLLVALVNVQFVLWQSVVHELRGFKFFFQRFNFFLFEKLKKISCVANALGCRYFFLSLI